MSLLNDFENKMDWAYEQHGSFKEHGNKNKTHLYPERGGEKGFGRFDTHNVYWWLDGNWKMAGILHNNLVKMDGKSEIERTSENTNLNKNNNV